MAMEMADGGQGFAPRPMQRFGPNDEEMVTLILHPYVKGQSLTCEGMLRRHNVYDAEPWKLLAAGEEEAYFLTPRTSKNGNIQRTAGCGFWRIQHSRIVCQEPLAHRSQLSFCLRKPDEDGFITTGWVMHEYVLGPTERKEARRQLVAVCRILRKPKAAMPASPPNGGVLGSQKRSRDPEDPSTSRPPIRRRVLDSGPVNSEDSIVSPSSIEQWAYASEDPSTSHDCLLYCQLPADGTPSTSADYFVSPSCVGQATGGPSIEQINDTSHDVYFATEPEEMPRQTRHEFSSELQSSHSEFSMEQPACVAENPLLTSHDSPLRRQVPADGTPSMSEDYFANPSCVRQATESPSIEQINDMSHNVYFATEPGEMPQQTQYEFSSELRTFPSEFSMEQRADVAENPSSTSHDSPLRGQVLADGTPTPADYFASPSCVEQASDDPSTIVSGTTAASHPLTTEELPLPGLVNPGDDHTGITDMPSFGSEFQKTIWDAMQEQSLEQINNGDCVDIWSGEPFPVDDFLWQLV